MTEFYVQRDYLHPKATICQISQHAMKNNSINRGKMFLTHQIKDRLLIGAACSVAVKLLKVGGSIPGVATIRSALLLGP